MVMIEVFFRNYGVIVRSLLRGLELHLCKTIYRVPVEAFFVACTFRTQDLRPSWFMF